MRAGKPWGTPTDATPDIEVVGRDSLVAAAVTASTALAPLVRMTTGDGDLARSVGWRDRALGVELEMDMLEVGQADAGELAVNAVVVGVAPDRLRRRHRAVPARVTIEGRVVHDGPATSIVVANGQFLRGDDLSPRGHPGDGRIEVQVYRVAARSRAEMRRRLSSGTHLDHPGITTASGREIRISTPRPRAVEIDGVSRQRRRSVVIRVLPGRCRLLV